MTAKICALFRICFLLFLWILHRRNQAFGCTSTTVQHKRPGDDVTIQFQARTINTENSALLVTNQILSYNGSTLLTVLYTNSVAVVTSSCSGCTFTGNAATGDLSVRLTNMQASDGGTYKHIIIESSAAAKGCVTVYILGIPESPTIQADKNNIEGRNIRLTCNSKSTTNPRDPDLSLLYKWKVDNAANPVDTRYIYSRSRHTLTINNLEKQDANIMLTCEATESGSDVTGLTSRSSNEYRINVLYGPDLQTTTLSPIQSTYTLEEGKILPNITCQGDCNPGCSYRWTKPENKEVASGDILSLGTLTRENAAVYTCLVTNPMTSSSVSRNVTVNVIYGPDANSVTLDPKPTTYVLNEQELLADITCGADCYPSCNFKWTKSGTSNYVSSTQKLQLGTLNRNEADTYTCTATNPTSRKIAIRSIIVSARYGPDRCEVSVPSQYNITEGTTPQGFTCQSECYPGCSYKWKNISDGTVISQNGALFLGTVSREHAGNYKCICKNTASQYQKEENTSVKIIVQYGPDANSIKLNPIGITHTRNEGSTLTNITCSTDCYPGCNYKWTKSGTRNAISSNGVLALGALNKNEAGVYTCTATNPKKSGSDSKQVTVNVRYGPDECNINVQSPYALAEGNTSTAIICQSDCYPSCSYKWINSSTGKVVGYEVFQLDSVKRYEAGNYTCTCENTAIIGTSKATPLQVIVYSASLFIEGHKGQKDVTVDEYDTDIQFNCEIDSYKESRVQILFKNVLLKEAYQPTVLTFTRSSITCSHAGVYTCKGSNQHAQAPSSNINLFVRCSPRPLQQIKQNKTSSLYVPATLIFTTIAYPEPGPTGFLWHKENGVLWMPLLSNNDLLVSSSRLQSNLTILNVSQSDYGRYKVTATNDIGSYEQYFFLVGKDIQKETYTTGSCEVESNKTGTIVGICFGVLSAGLAVYATYITVLHKRSTKKGKQTTEDLNTQVTYINEAKEGTVKHINDPSGNKDDSAKLYTELAQYSKDDTSTYDVIQRN